MTIPVCVLIFALPVRSRQVIGKTIFEEDPSKEEDTYDEQEEEKRRFRLAMVSLHILFALMRGPAFRALSWCWPRPLPAAKRRRRGGRQRASSSIPSSSRLSRSLPAISTLVKSMTVSPTRDSTVGAAGAANGAVSGGAAGGGSANSNATRSGLLLDGSREDSAEQLLEAQQFGATTAAEASAIVVKPTAPPAKSPSTTTPSECPEAAVGSTNGAIEKGCKSAPSPEPTQRALDCPRGGDLEDSRCVPRVVTTRRRRHFFWDTVNRWDGAR